MPLTCGTIAVPSQSEQKRLETVGDRYKRCTFLNEIQHIDIYGKVHRSYTEHKPYLTKNDAAFSVTSVSFFPTRLNERSHDGAENSRNPEAGTKLSSFHVTTKKSNLYPGQDNMSKRARKRWTACMKPTINTNAKYEASRVIPRV